MAGSISKPIILTGSMEPMSCVKSDAPGNILKAMLASTVDGLAGVYVAFDNKLLLASKVKKINPIQKDAFDTLDFPPVGLFNAQEGGMGFPYGLMLHETLIQDIQEVIGATKRNISTMIDHRVEILHLTPTTDLRIFDHYMRIGTRAVIIEGFGDGNVPSYIMTEKNENAIDSVGGTDKHIIRGKQFMNKVQACLDAGIVIALGSQCHTGPVLHQYTGGKNMIDIGVLSGKYMTTTAIYTKLLYLLANSDKIHQDFHKNLTGELFAGSDYIS